MATNTLTPNMSLILPAIGAEPGPTYGQDQNSSFTIVDGHNHSPGSGVQITPSGININTTLPFNGNPATTLGYLSLNTQASLTALSSLYVKYGSETVPIPDLWFNDGNGTAVQLTSNGQVNATAASIPGESYGSGTFTWRQGSGSTVPANFDIGSITIRPNTAGTSNGITLVPYSGIASQISLVLPALPSAQSFLTLDQSGNIIAAALYSGGITSSNIASATITGSNIASATITGSNIAANTVTRQNQVAVNIATSSSSGVVTTSATSAQAVPNMAVTLTTTGRPVVVMFQSDTSGAAASIGAETNGGGGQTSVQSFFQIQRDGVAISTVNIYQFASTTVVRELQLPPSAIAVTDTPSAASHTYTAYYYTQTGSLAMVNNCVLVAYEL